MIRVRHTVGRLAGDMAQIPVIASAEMVKITRDNANYGRDLAKNLARESAGKHGRHYPRSITSGPSQGPFRGGLRVGGASFEYGPDPAYPQGGMSFERGSRNQKPHLDLARSADVAGPEFARDVRRMTRRLFW